MQCTGRIGLVNINFSIQSVTGGLENSNPLPTHQSLNPADLLQILVVSTLRIKRVG